MKSNYKSIGELVERIDQRNTDGTVTNLIGVMQVYQRRSEKTKESSVKWLPNGFSQWELVKGLLL